MALAPSAVMIGLIALAFVLFSRDRPRTLVSRPMARKMYCPRRQDPPAMPSCSASPRSPSINERRVLGLAFTFFVCGVSSFGLMPHFVTLCGDFGISPIVSTGLLALIGICDLIGTIGSGWLSDRYDNRWLLACYYGFRGVSLIWLPYSGFSMVGLSVFAIFYGLDYIATIPPTVRLAVRRFGRDQAPVVFGWIFAAHQLGAGLMALAAGVSRDVFASYLPAFLAAGAICLMAALSLLLLRGRTEEGFWPPVPPDLSRRDQLGDRSPDIGGAGLAAYVVPNRDPLRKFSKRLT